MQTLTKPSAPAKRAAHTAASRPPATPPHRAHPRPHGSRAQSLARRLSRLTRTTRRWLARRAPRPPHALERRRGVPLRAAIVLAALLALGGGVLAAGLMGIGRGQPGHPAGAPFTRTEQATTSFGLIQVESVEASQGLTSAQLSGQNHGIQGLVNPDQMEVQVSLTIKNSIDAPITFAPEMFALISDNGAAAVAPTFSDFESDTLQPRAQVEGTLSFIAPLGAKKLLLRFDDPGQHQSFTIDLGQVTVGVTR